MKRTVKKRKTLRFAVTMICAAIVLTMLIPTAFAADSLLKLGSAGSEVTRLQNRLLELGYLDYPNATGYFGTTTKTAVTRFQQNNGLYVDGIAGSATSSKLYSSTAKSMVLKAGSSGEAVQSMQLRLKALGYFGGTGTGYFGGVTLDAVTRFQKAKGLYADGIAGPATHRAIFSGSTAGGSGSSTGSSAAVSAIADIALAQVGKPYVLSTEGPSTFDCSGLAYYAMTQAGYSVTRMSAAAYSTYSAWTTIYSASELQKGDLLFFRSDTSSSVNHMGVYTGGGQFVHASSGQGKVMVSDLGNTYWARNFVRAKRVS